MLSSVHMMNVIKICLINVLISKNDSRYESTTFAPSYIYLVVVFYLQIYTQISIHVSQ